MGIFTSEWPFLATMTKFTVFHCKVLSKCFLNATLYMKSNNLMEEYVTCRYQCGDLFKSLRAFFIYFQLLMFVLLHKFDLLYSFCVIVRLFHLSHNQTFIL